MDKANRLEAIKRGMDLYLAYKQIEDAGGTLTPEQQSLFAVCEEYEQLCGLVLTQNQTIQAMQAEQAEDGGGQVLPVFTMPSQPVENKPEAEPAMPVIFDIVTDGTSVTVKRSE